MYKIQWCGNRREKPQSHRYFDSRKQGFKEKQSLCFVNE